MLKSPLYRPEALLAGTFAALIGAGTILLWLPISHTDQPVGLVDALFTSTSAVCVTGLTAVNTATRFSHFGHVVILVLIQLGGLGIMTFAALAAQFLRLHLSFSSHLAWQSAFFDEGARGGLQRALRRIFLMTAIIEGLGAALLYVGLRTGRPVSGGWFEAVFHSISAFCNAGFSVYTDNVVAFDGSPLILLVLMGLIIAGGLGYTVWFELVDRAWRYLRGGHDGAVVWSLHSRVVLKVSAGLVFGGALLLLVTGLDTARPLGSSVIHALFQSVTARTAGFNSVEIGLLPVPSLLVLIGLMFVGGSPGSCAGGIKTTCAAVWVAHVRARLSGQEEATLGRRRLPRDTVRRAAHVLSLAALWNLLGVFLLTITEQGHPAARLEALIFEQISAFGTVGLSADLTPTLSVLGKLWIVATMFVGRVGPLTLAIAVITPPRMLYKHPTERVMIG